MYNNGYKVKLLTALCCAVADIGVGALKASAFVKYILLPAFIFFCMPLAVVHVNAEDLTAAAQELEISVECPEGSASRLTDGKEKTYTSAGTVTVTSSGGEPIYSLYVIFDRIYGSWTLSGTGSDGEIRTAECGENGFLHEYVDVAEKLGEGCCEVTLKFEGDEASLSEIHAFSSGDVPDWVQIWQPPCERADLLLNSTHVDDEQLFFAGLLPYYAGERGYAVQVVYFTDPFQYHDRPHEQLNGLWTVGVRNYPVCGVFVDKLSETAEDAYRHQERYGYTKEDMIKFQVQMLRRFKPHVAVGHDINGEYGHGQHMINCETLMEALPLAADPGYDPESAQEYGVWDVPKTYIHLWKENEIVMDWDVPLESFGGRTAFQMSQEGFMCHESQHWTWFYGWIYGSDGRTVTKATQIRSSTPCKYGLYRTQVGLDTGIGDMFENIPQSYAEIEREEEERAERERLELERLENERAESEAAESRRIEEESRRLESELEESRRLEEEAASLAAAQTEPTEFSEGDGESRKKPHANADGIAAAAAVCAVLALLTVIVARAVKRKKR